MNGRGEARDMKMGEIVKLFGAGLSYLIAAHTINIQGVGTAFAQVLYQVGAVQVAGGLTRYDE